MRIAFARSLIVPALLLMAGPLAKQASAQGSPAGPAVETAYQAILANPKVTQDA